MKKILFPIVFAFISTLLSAQTNTLPFKAGEKLDVILNYKWGITADIATLSFNLQPTSNGNFHIVLNARTNKFFDSFYKVRDVYETKFEPDMDPVYFMRRVSEGNFTAYNEYTWSPDKKTLHARVEKSSLAAPVDTTFTSKEIVRDVINLVYSIRASDFNSIIAGKPATLLVAMDRNITRATYSFVARETRKVDGLGTFNTICLAMNLQRISGDDLSNDTKLVVPTGSDSKNTIYIWLSDDGNRIPLHISLPISVGKIEIRASNFENCKYPLTSKIK